MINYTIQNGIDFKLNLAILCSINKFQEFITEKSGFAHH